MGNAAAQFFVRVPLRGWDRMIVDAFLKPYELTVEATKVGELEPSEVSAW